MDSFSAPLSLALCISRTIFDGTLPFTAAVVVFAAAIIAVIIVAVADSLPLPPQFHLLISAIYFVLVFHFYYDV